MKVALAAKAVYPFHSFGGVQKYVYSLAKALQREGVEVEIVTSTALGHNGKAQVGHSETYEGMVYRFLPPEMQHRIERPEGWLWMHYWSRNLAKYLAGAQFDVVHGFELAPLYYLKNKKRVPVVYQLFLDTHRVKSVSRVSLRKYFSPKLALKSPAIYGMKLLPVKYCLDRSELVATEGGFQSDELETDFDVKQSKMFPIGIGIDLEVMGQRLSKTPRVSRKDLGFQEDDFVVISVNRLIPEKGLLTLVQAMGELRAKSEKIKFLMVGKGAQESDLMSLAQQLGIRDRIVHQSEVLEADLYDLYRLSNLYVSPTLQDDYIMSIQEAMACSLPVVSTGQRWLVEEGVNGYVVPKMKPEMMASRIFELSQNPSLREKMGRNSAELIKKFDWKRIAQETLVQYALLVGEKSHVQ